MSTTYNLVKHCKTPLPQMNQNPSTTFTWNTIIRASPPQQALHLYNQMLSSPASPNKFTFTFLIKACSNSNSTTHYGKHLHCHLLKLGFASDIFLQSALVRMYALTGHIIIARKVFDQCSNPDLVSWTALVSAYANVGLLDDARQVFDKMPERNAVSWAALIAGYSRTSRHLDALAVFDEMLEAQVLPNEATLVSVLSTSAHVGALDRGKWVHAFVERNRIPLTPTLGTALVDMYAKCGSIDEAERVFIGMTWKDTFTWSVMISGMAMHGQGELALRLFDEMLDQGLRPDHVTFVGVLNACSHAGLIDKGRRYFKNMKDLYEIEPRIEHYACMVDILGRGGFLEEAWKLVQSMPMKPDVVVLKTLLNASSCYKNVGCAEWAAKELIELDKNHGASYVLLSNVYAGVGRWDDSERVRREMRDLRFVKTPGFSLIEIGGIVHKFIVGDNEEHPRIKEINVMLDEVGKQLKLAGHVPQLEQVLFDIDDEEKESVLGRHSEKLGIVFGLMSITPPTPIRIVKNLRICTDCHETIKLMSRVFGREIIVRDSLWFHHFGRGSCSCRDYW